MRRSPKQKLFLLSTVAVTGAVSTINPTIGEAASPTTQDISLPTVGAVNGSNIQWTSSNQQIITNDGKVTRQLDDTTVTLTAYLTNRYEHYSVKVTLTVEGTNGTTGIN